MSGFVTVHVINPFFFGFSEIDGNLFHCCQDDEKISIQLLGTQVADEILIDDSGSAFQVIALKSNGDTAAAAGDDQLTGLYQRADRADFDDFHRLGRSNHTAVAASCIFLHDIAVFFFCFFCLFSSHKMTDGLGRAFESGIFGINTDLRDHCRNRHIENTTVVQLFTKCILQIVADISLAHGNTHRQRCIGLTGVFAGQSSHGIIDHANLRTIAVRNNNFTAFLNQINDGAGSNLNSLHLFRKCISQSIAPKSNHDSFFLFHKTKFLHMIQKMQPPAG